MMAQWLGLSAIALAGGYVITTAGYPSLFILGAALTAASLAGLALSPVVSGLLTRSGFLLVFVLNLVVLAALVVFLWRRPGRLQRAEAVDEGPGMME